MQKGVAKWLEKKAWQNGWTGSGKTTAHASDPG
jgi:hypothetical protein